MSLLTIKFCADQDRFLREFLQLSFVEQAFADCTLYCWAEERTGSHSNQQPRTYRTFKCHRLVLSAYSDFFRHCFLDSAKSNVSSLFLDIEPRTLESILRLIYFSEIEIHQSDIELFFNAATKLSLKDFKISNEVFNVDSDLNHLKRRLTQDESQPLSLKSTKHTKGASVEHHHQKSVDKGQTEGEDASHREESRCQADDKPPMLEQQQSPAANVGGRLNFGSTNSSPIAADSSPAQDVTAAGGGSAFTCTICSKQYSYKISLNKHIKSAHAN